MTSQWRKPTQAETTLGYVAMLPRVYHCYTERGLLTIGYSGGYTDKDSKTTYPKRQMWAGYTQIMLDRRASYSDDVPAWYEKAPIVDATIETLHEVEAPKASDDEWMIYVTGKDPSAAVTKTIEILKAA